MDLETSGPVPIFVQFRLREGKISGIYTTND